jgi:hypothetical protein
VHHLDHQRRRIDARVIAAKFLQQLADHSAHGPARIIRRRQALGHPDTPARHQVGDTVGKGAADIDGDADPATGPAGSPLQRHSRSPHRKSYVLAR